MRQLSLLFRSRWMFIISVAGLLVLSACGEPSGDGPRITSLESSPSVVQAGEALTFTWAIEGEGPFRCTLEIPGAGFDPVVLNPCGASFETSLSQAGSYTASFTVLDSDDRVATFTISVTIDEAPPSNEPPVIESFSVTPDSVEVDEEVTFAWDTFDPDGDELTCKLTHGDGSSSTMVDLCPEGESSTSHTYDAVGTFSAELLVSDGTTTTSRSVGVTVEERSFAHVSAGESHSLELDADGNGWAWGRNTSGMLGNDSTTDSSTRVAVSMPAGVTFTQVSAGGVHSLALDTNGNAWAWGESASGQLGTGTTEDASVPVAVSMPPGVAFLQVSAGTLHSVAVDVDGKAWAWGNNNAGQLGDGSTDRSSVPIEVSMPEGVRFTEVSADFFHSLALETNGNAWAWGDNFYGQLGDDSTTDSSVPVQVHMPEDVTFTHLSAAESHSMALDAGGDGWAWGRNLYGALGIGNAPDSSIPVAVGTPSGVTFTQVSAGGLYSMALDADGNAWAWGFNSHGQLGNDTTMGAGLPLAVSMPSGVKFGHVSAGTSHALALDVDGNPWAWGNNTDGRLGDGTTTDSLVPVAVTIP